MFDHRYYDREGKPIDIVQYSMKFEDPDYKIVRQTEIGEIMISTVWLGLDHNHGRGQPIIFETMIFGGDDDGWMERYAFEDKAIARHEEICDLIGRGERIEDGHEDYEE